MAGRIYLLENDSRLVAMQETPYDSEKLLQKLLADYPDLLAGEQINSVEPRRWLLVSREMQVPDDEDGSGRWSLDHLFLDQDAVPTLVEVKRSSDSRIRRAVVGQMLDYAANAVAYWPVEEIKAKFETRCAKNGSEPEELIASLLGPDGNIEEFWQRVKTNLQAGRIRLVFVADLIPAELRRVVEFLNKQMDPAEVLAIEVRQFIGEGMKTLAPIVLGQTAAKASGPRSGETWDAPKFMQAVRDGYGAAAEAAAIELLDWIEPQVSRIWWGSGASLGGIVPVIERGNAKYYVCRMTTHGRFVFCFDWLSRRPPFDDEAVRRKLLAKINEIPGVRFEDDVLKKRARIQFETLANPASMQKLKAAVTWMIAQIPNLASNRSSAD